MPTKKALLAGLGFALLLSCAATREDAGDYFEHRKDGRIYVVGSRAMSRFFRQQGHLPYARTLIGKGPKGETVVIESQKDGDELANRLEQEFWKRHPKT